MGAEPAATPPSKARKILRRTLSGARLVAGLALILWLASRSNDGEPVLYAAAIALLLAVFELARMGKCAELLPGLVVGVPAVATIALELSALRADRRAREQHLLPEALQDAWRVDLALQYAFVALGALAVHALVRLGPRKSVLSRAGTLVALALLVAFVVAIWRDPTAARAHVRLALLVLGAIAVAAIPLFVARRALGAALASAALAAWLVPPLPCLWHVWRDFGSEGLVAVLVLSKIGDTAGYYFGSWLGKTHPFPSISPGKTTAGCVASFVVATVVGGVLVATGLLPDARFGVLAGLAAGAALNLAAQAGDLLESWVKRRAGVKDSSTWFGPSGGLLDQVDSLLLSVPVAMIVLPLLFGA